MSIFPQNFGQALITPGSSAPTLPMAKEYAWDFINNNFLLVDGKNVTVTGAAAVKVWVWKTLLTTKNLYQAYSSNFGNELESLIGQGLSNAAQESELQRYIREALQASPYVLGISNVSLMEAGSLAAITFTVDTIYGEVVISV